MEGFTHFTEEALQRMDGMEVPLTLEIGGPQVGVAVMKYNPETKSLDADLRVDDPEVAALFKGTLPYSIKKESE